jgi:hypothetical protein
MRMIVPLFLLSLLAFTALGASRAPGAKLEVDRTRGTADLVAKGASLHDLVGILEIRTGKRVLREFADRRVDLDLRSVPVDDILRRVARETGLRIIEDAVTIRLIEPEELSVWLDVVDGEIEELVRSLARQCGVRNVMIRPGLQGKGTFVLRDVPCGAAFRAVFGTLGVEGRMEPNSVLLVERRR